MKYIFSENKLVFKKKKGLNKSKETIKPKPSISEMAISITPQSISKGVKYVGDKLSKGLNALADAMSKKKKTIKVESKSKLKDISKDLKVAVKANLKPKDKITKLSKKEIVNAFAFVSAEKNKFKPDEIEKMVEISRKMSIYNLWSGGIRRLSKEKGLKKNQGFSRMAAQFAKQKEDEQGRAYLEINLHGKDKFESNIGAGHICPPSWKKVAIVDGGGEISIGTRKIPGVDGVQGHKIGYYDDQGNYLAVYTGYKVYPLSVLSEAEKSDKQVIDTQIKKENEYYVENKEKLQKYARRSSASLSRRGMSKMEIQRIRDQISGLEEEKNPGKRVAMVAEYVTENNIYAKHCWNWVDRVYAIAGITKKDKLHHDMSYAKDSNGEWKRKLKPKSEWTREEVSAKGKGALDRDPNLVDGLKPGAWLWLAVQNLDSKEGGHSVIFVRWKDKEKRLAVCASWLGGKKGQKTTTYDFNKTPIVNIEDPSAIKDKFVRVADEEMVEYERMRNLSTSDKVKLGMTPFKVKVGYQMTKTEYAWYKNERAKAHRLKKLNINERMRILNEKYRLLDGINDSAKMLGISQKNMKFFLAYNDAVLRVESNYNAFCVNHKKGKIALSSAAGEYQIIYPTYKETKDFVKKGYYNKVVPNLSVWRNAKINASRAEFLTPYQRAIFHNLYAFAISRRASAKVMPIDEIFTQIRNAPNPKMRRSYIKLMYTYWRNGHGGARPFFNNLQKGIPLPETQAEAQAYYDKYLHLKTWQGRRMTGRGENRRNDQGKDFWGLMRTCNKYANRFEKNLSEL